MLVWNMKTGIFGIFLSLVACGKKSDASTDPDSPGANLLPLAYEPTTENVQKNVVDKACLRCHSRAKARSKFVDLTDISKVIGTIQAPAGQARTDSIRPGCPNQSVFYTEMKEGTMPPRGQKVADEDLLVIERWITQLAPSADCSH